MEGSYTLLYDHDFNKKKAMLPIAEEQILTVRQPIDIHKINERTIYRMAEMNGAKSGSVI